MSGFAVGAESVLVVGMQGVVETVTAESITIGGIELPTRLDHKRGVRYLSLLWPDADPCDRKHCDSICDAEPADSDARDDLESLAAIIREQHEDTHNEAMQFCRNRLCREVYDLGVIA